MNPHGFFLCTYLPTADFDNTRSHTLLHALAPSQLRAQTCTLLGTHVNTHRLQATDNDTRKLKVLKFLPPINAPATTTTTVAKTTTEATTTATHNPIDNNSKDN